MPILPKWKNKHVQSKSNKATCADHSIPRPKLPRKRVAACSLPSEKVAHFLVQPAQHARAGLPSQKRQPSTQLRGPRERKGPSEPRRSAKQHTRGLEAIFRPKGPAARAIATAERYLLATAEAGDARARMRTKKCECAPHHQSCVV